MKSKFVVLLSSIMIAGILFGCLATDESISSQKNSKNEEPDIFQEVEKEAKEEKTEDSEEGRKLENINGQVVPDRQYTQEELEEMRLSALSKSYPPLEVDVLEKETYTNLFFRGVKSDDKIFQRLSLFLLDAKIGSEVADINYSTKAAFKSIKELDNTVLFRCAIENAKYFSWERNNTNADGITEYHLDGYECFFTYAKSERGYFKEDIEEQAYFVFGEGAIIDPQKINGAYTRPNSIYIYDDYTGVYIPPGVDSGGRSYPYVLSYEEKEDCYDIVFTSICIKWGGGGRLENPWLGDAKAKEMSVDEAIEWYTEHGARARVILEEQEDGRLIVKSLEILRGYDTLEEIEAQKAYGK